MSTLYAIARRAGGGQPSGLMTYEGNAPALAPGNPIVFLTRDKADAFIDSLTHGVAKFLEVVDFYESPKSAP